MRFDWDGAKAASNLKKHRVSSPVAFSKSGAMHTLRLTQSAEGQNRHRVEVALEGDGGARQSAVSRFEFALSAQDQEDLRWYLEDYLEYPLDPAPKVAARIETRMAAIGAELFAAIFQSNEDTRRLWGGARPRLGDMRVEIVSGVREATSIPWELLREPNADTPLSLRARSFVRTSQQAAHASSFTHNGAGPIRILLVICRPGGRSDVPFRSVANRLLRGLGATERENVDLTVLRPPTFERLSRTLWEAATNGTPFHIVHFDGHGAYGEGGPRAGAHGYLIFENPALNENREFVDGPKIGELLAETRSPVLILNACRSAHGGTPSASPNIAVSDTHSETRAFGSLAQEIMDAGAASVVALRYNVYVETAARFMADLYDTLSQGLTLGEAVNLGRRQLRADPRRSIAFEPVPLQDWAVPVVFETAPLALFPKHAGARKLTITLGDASTPTSESTSAALPAPPDAGFFGRDETLLALDRAFDSQPIVLLHAYAGSGKTTTAAEFARWYAFTGGVEGPVLFTTFEAGIGEHKTLVRVMDAFGDVFGQMIEGAGGEPWLASSERERRAAALRVMRQIPVLWIWDNVEPIAGFPAGTPSRWTAEEQKELADFLRAARDTKAKFLLASRRDERGWLGDLPARVAVPPMPFQERVQLARALAEKHRRRLTDVDDWRPLLEFTQGNPLTITVLVGQALRDGVKTKQQVAGFVDRLRKGEAAFKDEASEGRTKSLAASLGYGFVNAFNESERKQLVLLHLFQGFVNVDVLRVMGRPEQEWHVPEIRGITREQALALLDRAAEIGLLTGHGGGYYSIHPALPWFFQKWFDQYYANAKERATRAFAETMGSLGTYYHKRYGEGLTDVVDDLRAEEANLRQARALARARGWWDTLIEAMQGLRTLYEHTGRRAEWAQLVQEIVPQFVDPATDGPLPGREEQWSLVTDYRVRLARQARQWPEAERLQRITVEWNRRRASPATGLSPDRVDPAQRHEIHSLAASLHALGEIQRELGQPECVQSYDESYELALGINDRPAAAAFNLGTAYRDLPAIRNLEEAERWYRRSLELHAREDSLHRARCLVQLGTVSHERFREAQETDEPQQELLKHLNAARDLYLQALELIPQDAIADSAAIHGQLGNIYCDAGDVDRALAHYRECIGYMEHGGDVYGAAQARSNLALTLRRAGRFPDAREYALAALRGYQTFGDRAKDEVTRTLKMIAQIEQAQKSGVRNQKSE
jgi:tetratricopeptide (TPR) repeat protein